MSEAPLAVTPGLAYAVMDGLFQHALLMHLSGDTSAVSDLDEHVQHVMTTLLARS